METQSTLPNHLYNKQNPTFGSVIRAHTKAFLEANSGKEVSINNLNLTIGQVVSVARNPTRVHLTSDAINLTNECNDVIGRKLGKGEVIYGVNTGVGGSADTRTPSVNDVQKSLFTHQMCGIIPKQKEALERQPGEAAKTRPVFKLALELDDVVFWRAVMPQCWVRASMVIRLNSLCAGASGIRVCVAESLVELLNKWVTPVVPLRGSISASGDLSPLSYIGAVMQGIPSSQALLVTEGESVLLRADDALLLANIQPIDLQAKEGLSIVNGTSVSAGVAALAMHECLYLAMFSQVLTAMTVEALCGSGEGFDSFVHQLQPHTGQVDCAFNIRQFLRGSKLTTRQEDWAPEGLLRQDRYSIRTAAQWIGPVLEDFVLAYDQIETELNSVTDNPLIDVDKDRILYGGNFQARSITSATEKLRQGLQSLGRMLFSQCTELINPATNNGIPRDVAADRSTDLSALFKGVDITIAALISELGFLANPVGTHVHTAEMGNQSLNSLALISARYSLEAVEILQQLAAAHLVVLCQALDLRVQSRDGHDITPHLGMASRKMYDYVRNDLDVPLLSEVEFSLEYDPPGPGVFPTIGQEITTIYESIRKGEMYRVVMACHEDTTSLGGTGATDMESSGYRDHVAKLRQQREERRLKPTLERLSSRPSSI